MDLILHQLGELVLGSVPTILLFILLIIAYSLLVERPLDRILAERRARTTGAMDQARAAIAAAEAKTSLFEDRLRSARGDIFADREARLKRWNEERDAALHQVRQRSADRIKDARTGIEASATAARTQIQAVSSDLSAQILNAVLPAGISSREAAQ